MRIDQTGRLKAVLDKLIMTLSLLSICTLKSLFCAFRLNKFTLVLSCTIRMLRFVYQALLELVHVESSLMST